MKPLLVTDTPICGEDGQKLACGDQTCIAKELFCDGNKDCNDGSDENLCGKFNIVTLMLHTAAGSTRC